MAYIGKSPDGTGVRSRFYYTQSSGGGTSVSGSSDDGTTLAFSDGAYVDVFLNGVLLVAGTDYNTSTANTISGLAALANGDVVEVVVYDIFTVADTVSSLNGGTFSNNVTINGDLTVDTSTLKVDSSNNRVGVGTISPDHTLTVSASTSPTLEIEQTSGGPYKTNIVLNGNDTEFRGSSGAIEFYTGNDDGASSTERMRLSGSDFQVSQNGTVTTAGTVSGMNISAQYGTFQVNMHGNDYPVMNIHTTGSANIYSNFRFGNSTVGNISTDGSSTTYAGTSDYRLKENVADMTGAIDRVKALAPKRFNFIVNPDKTVDGFLAHEAQTVVPEAVTGTHNEVDDDGNPVMQGIDQSKLVPLLTGALKEAIAKIEALETKVAALEAGE